MTREEAIKELKEYEDGLDLEYATPFDKAILYAIKALEQEPTTKNNLGVENDSVSSIVEKISEKVTETREEFIFETIRPYCENVVQMKISKRDLEQALLKYYGKNDLEVDCISRKDVLKLMQDNWHTHNGDWAMQESMDDIRALPSVTPQEPKPMVEIDLYSVIKQKYIEREVLDKIRAEIIQSIQNGTLKIESGNEELFNILDKYKTESETQ